MLTCSEQENHFLQTASVCTSHRLPHFFRWSTTTKETNSAQWTLAWIISVLGRRPRVARYLSKTEIFQTYLNKSVSTTSVFKSYLPVHTDMRNQNDLKTPASTNSACAHLGACALSGIAGLRKNRRLRHLFLDSFFLAPKNQDPTSEVIENLWFDKPPFSKITIWCVYEKRNPCFWRPKTPSLYVGRENRVEISVFENDPD